MIKTIAFIILYTIGYIQNVAYKINFALTADKCERAVTRCYNTNNWTPMCDSCLNVWQQQGYNY